MKSTVPRVAVGAVIVEKEKVLLVKRKNPPAQGLWAIPGGKVRWGETLQQALKREIKEEINVEIEPGDLLKVVELVPKQGDAHFHYIILDYWATIVSGTPQAGDDALQVRWFGKEDLKNGTITESTMNLLREILGF